MLTSLTVKQFGLIESAYLELESGMTVFTGETGAGKSMLVDALGALFGARASSDWVRHGAERADVTAIWSGSDERIAALLHEQAIEPEDELILRRVINSDGRSRAFVNGTPVAMKILQQLGNICLDLHGQHEHQSLMQASVQRQLLDQRLDGGLLSEVQQAFTAWRQARERLESLQAERGDTEQQAAWMREELERLQQLGPEEGMVDALQAEVDGGRHHAQIQQAAAQALALLDESEPSVREMVARALSDLIHVEEYHPGLKRARELLDQMEALLGEAVPELRDVLDRSFDEQGLRAAESRLFDLHEAMRRHQSDEAGLLALMADWESRLSALDTAGWDEASLTGALKQAADAFKNAAAALSRARQSCGEQMSRQLRPFLDRLALSGMQVRFSIEEVQGEAAWSANGWDAITMEVMSNPGEPWRPLASVASGGELSRLVLALKGCGALQQMPHIAVFDEVDTGIGGETAWSVGEMLAVMGRERQVLVISHLPQVASCADHQVVISKSEKDGRTTTSLQTVGGEAREQEIARMLGGSGAQTLQHARDMLTRAGAVA